MNISRLFNIKFDLDFYRRVRRNMLRANYALCLLHCMSCLVSSCFCLVMSYPVCQRFECWQIIPHHSEAIRDFFGGNSARSQPLPYVLLAINHRNTATFFRHFSSFFLVRLSVETVIMASLSLNCIELSIIPFIISLTLKKNEHVVRG